MCNYAKLQTGKSSWSTLRDVRQIKPKLFSVPETDRDLVVMYMYKFYSVEKFDVGHSWDLSQTVVATL